MATEPEGRASVDGYLDKTGPRDGLADAIRARALDAFTAARTGCQYATDRRSWSASGAATHGAADLLNMLGRPGAGRR